MTRVTANHTRRSVQRACSALIFGVAVSAGAAGPAAAPESAPAEAADVRPTLRVGTSADYAPFSFDPEGVAPLDGFDVALAHAYAADRHLTPGFIPFAWPELETRLAAGDFDVVMSGITVRPDRSLVGRFTTPVTESGAVVLVRDVAEPRSLGALEAPGVRLAVNRGGHLERATRARFPAATVIALPDNQAVLAELLAARADGAVTDTLEVRSWQARASGLVALGPFTRDRKALLLPANAGERAADLDRWLAAKEADGTLASLRARWLGAAGSMATADPLPALVAALDERLALMPLVAEAKRREGKPVRDPAQEVRVLAAATREVAAAATDAGRPAPPPDCIEAFFQAQIDAGSAVQEAVLARPAKLASAVPDLATATRPALARIGTRVAAALVRLPPGLTETAVRTAARDGLRTPDLNEGAARALEDALVRCAVAAGP